MEIKVSCWYAIYRRRLQRLSLYAIDMDVLKRSDVKIGVLSPYSAQYTHRCWQLKATELVEIEYGVGISTTIVVFKVLVDMLSIWINWKFEFIYYPHECIVEIGWMCS